MVIYWSIIGQFTREKHGNHRKYTSRTKNKPCRHHCKQKFIVTSTQKFLSDKCFPRICVDDISFFNGFFLYLSTRKCLSCRYISLNCKLYSFSIGYTHRNSPKILFNKKTLCYMSYLPTYCNIHIF